MSPDELVEAAREHARRSGRDPSSYEAGEPSAAGDRVSVLFHNPQGPPGDHFSVELDAATGALVGIQPGE